MTKVLLYCIQPILEAGLRPIVENLPDFHLLECCSSTDSLKHQAKTFLPELLLVEVTSAITLDFLQELMGLSGGARIALWVDGASNEFLSQTLGIGVRGILPKDQSLSAHAQCLLSVAAGEIWLDRDLAGTLLSRKQVRLTPRERQLIGLLSQGLKNKEIAFAMEITEGTVKVSLSRLFAKVGANDRFDLALIGLRNIEANQSNALDRVAAKSPGRAVPFRIPAYLSTERSPVAA